MFIPNGKNVRGSVVLQDENGAELIWIEDAEQGRCRPPAEERDGEEGADGGRMKHPRK